MTNRSRLACALLLLSTSAHAAIDDDSEGGGVTPDTGPSDAGTIAYSFSYAPSWGTDNWGAGLAASGVVTARPAASVSDRDRATAAGQLSATAKVNGTRYRLLGVRANGDVENGRKARMFASASIGSAEIWNYASETTLANNMVAVLAQSWERTLLDQRVGVWVGPVPVEFRVQVQGQLGANIDLSLNLTRIGVTFTPRASASLHASAAIGGEACALGVCVGASAGVYADLNLFSVRTPTRLEMALTPLQNGVRASAVVRGDAVTTTLDGELGVFAEAHAGPFDESWHLSLVDWAGISSSAPIANIATSACLVGSCLTPITGTTPRK